jgi:hypothetical protein
MAAFILLHTGRAAQSLPMLERAQQLSPGRTMAYAHLAGACVRSGDRDRAEVMRLDIERAQGYVSPLVRASICAALGNMDEFYALMKSAIDAREPLAVHLKVNPGFFNLDPDALNESRTIEMLQRMKLAP